MTSTLLQEAKSLNERTVALRRQIHQHPELGLHLPRTQKAVLDALAGLDLDIALSKQTCGHA